VSQAASPSSAQSPSEKAPLLLKDFRPVAMIRRPLSELGRVPWPIVDIHNHLGKWLHPNHEWIIPDVHELLENMSTTNVQLIVNLDGRWGKELDENVARYDSLFPDKFATFCHLDWTRLKEPGATELLIQDLHRAKDQGARGVKVWKDLGLHVRDGFEQLVSPDDKRLTDVFTAAGELGLPILIHTADPIAFFQPLDGANERFEELQREPTWWFGSEQFPPFDHLMSALENVIRNSPLTTFMGAHVGCAAEDLDWVSRMLNTYQNFYIDLGGRLAELGRQPIRFRKLVERHPSRVLFGTDDYPFNLQIIDTYRRFIETEDEYFSYSADADIPPQGRWNISGSNIPIGLQSALYSENARRLLRL
jgi:predicted TIM-barrel fold metal-dependent hydrolase